ncbi:YtxH domain-containing protein [Candidatus Curtissbacteria bacterium]|nr:YtxH domain-containing protein [Candidatus Curtissbacteria bacterium]
MSDQKDNSLTAFVAGVIIGAAATYLFTNEKGQKIKDKLIGEGSKVLDKLKEGLEEVEKEVQKEKAEIAQKIESGVDTVKEAAEEVAESVPEHIEQIQKKGRRFFFRKHSPES